MKYIVRFDVVVDGPGDLGPVSEASFQGEVSSPALPRKGELLVLKFQHYANIDMKVSEVEHVLSTGARRGVAALVVYLEEKRFKLKRCDDSDVDRFWDELEAELKAHGFVVEE